MAFVTTIPTFFLPFSSPLQRYKGKCPTYHNIPRCKLDPGELISKQLVCLGSQHIGDEGAVAVAAALRHPASQIVHVNLDSCDITCVGAIALAEGIRGNTKLEELVLFDNSIADDGAASLADALADSPSALRVLSLPRNRIGPKGGAALGKMIATNRALRNVYLMGQSHKGAGMGDEGALAWAEGIAKNQGNFWFVNLNGNGITDRGLEALKRARVEGKHCVFPADPYPGPKTAS